MSYTIGQVAEETGLSIHTLRFYEKEGILPPVKRNESSRRVYDSADIEWLKFACCLRDTGMTIAEMKRFAQLTIQGDETIKERIKLLLEQKERINSQIDQLTNYQSMIDYKIKFYSNNVRHLSDK
ncbi:MerR family transcriptional regulator [Bacillus sp. V33-4]|uniref:MerR family transcriptional regulator n=1 Tax=Bacillus sp. V33-4 TaxID=2054169 RepID=UPI000C76CD15|nr:MerR family transcriptional regulator [Bacillus sp. V33-4]PLR80724.1 MerR family transcriptional regulator [Bacillus sp. V33-4]